MRSFAITDVGQRRSMNQDAIYCREQAIGNLPNLFIVADGMGGHHAGDVASKLCISSVIEKVKESKEEMPIHILEEAIRHANDMILQEANEKKEWEGMGTTLVLATIKKDVMYVANIGDSRLYLIREQLRQITEDHSLVEELMKKGELEEAQAKHHPNKNIITRAIGMQPYISPDYFEVSIRSDELILLCSDGLSNMLEGEEIKNIIDVCESDLEKAGKMLVEKANAHGGRDNISLILVQK